MIGTRVGYAGGTTERPTYHRLEDHMEAVEVTFDPEEVSYAELLDVFWESHPAALEPGPERVRTAVLTREDQLEAALESKRRIEEVTGEPVFTEVLPAGPFWPAEDRHQKFNLKRLGPSVVRQLEDLYQGPGDFLSSTTAARLNAFVGGFGGDRALAAAASELGLGIEELRRLFSGGSNNPG